MMDPRRLTIAAVIVAVVAIGAIFGVRAHRVADDRDPAKPRVAATSEIEGTIDEVSKDALVLHGDDGRTHRLRVGPRPIDLSHLQQHSMLALPVRATVTGRGRDRIVLSVEDIVPRTPDERLRASGLPSKLDAATFRKLRVGMTQSEVSRIAGLPLYQGIAGARANESCWQWEPIAGPRATYFEACFRSGADPRVATLDASAR